MLSASLRKVVKKNRKMPNAVVRMAFKSKYPKATFTIWKQIDVFKWQVNFITKERQYTGLFDSEGNWLETINMVPLNFIPENVKQSFEEKYCSDGLRQIYQIQTPNRTLFEIQWNNDLYALKLVYDIAGKIVGKMMSKINGR